MGIPTGELGRIEGGLDIHYHEAGSGPPVIFIHGSGPGASGYSNFKLNFPAFAEAGYRAIVPDLIGYGYSSKPADAIYHLDFFVETLLQFMDSVGVDDCFLVGNSLGGAVAISIALRCPDRVNKLILMAPGGIEDIEIYRQMPGIQAMMSGFLSDDGLDRIGLAKLLSLQLFQPETKSALVEQAVEERFEVMQQQPKAVLSTLTVPDHTELLSTLQCPILGYWGMDDKFCPSSGAMKILKSCSDARFTLMSDCGHWVMLEHPHYFNRESLYFLSE